MVFSGTSLLAGISQGGAATGKASAAQLMTSATGHLDRMMRSNPNESNIVHSMSRAQLAANFHNQAYDPIGAIIANSSRAWTGVGAQHVS